MIDYKEIIDNLIPEKIIQLMEGLGADRYEDKDGYIVFPTICHNVDSSEASMKLYYYKNTHMFYCYTECGAMSIFKLLQEYYETRQIEYDWYQDILQVIESCSIKKNKNGIEGYKSNRSDYEQQKARRELPAYPEGVLDCFISHFYPVEWLNDRITKEAMDKYNIRYSISQNKIIIPHYDVNGRLVGIRGRALNKEDIENFGKYMPIQIENKWYSHPLSLNLYGLYENRNNIKQNGIAFVFESEKSVLQFENFQKFKNCAVASCGSNLNKYQIDLLVRYCHPYEIVVCYDNEELPKESKYFQKLWNMCNKYKNYCNVSFIYDRNQISKLKDSPSDNGEEVFIRLLKERIKIK